MTRKVSGKVDIPVPPYTENEDIYVYERTLRYNLEKGYTE